MLEMANGGRFEKYKDKCKKDIENLENSWNLTAFYQ